jgi:hypothetical protein
MGKADPLASRCSVKGCREQQIFIWLARFGCKLGLDFGCLEGDVVLPQLYWCSPGCD